MAIKKIISTMGIILISLSLTACSNNSAAGKEIKEETKWKVVSTVKVPDKTYVAGMLNDKFGITVGYSGACNYTDDAGKTWTEGKNESFCRFGLEIVNDKVAYNCGNGGHVRKTIDGGKTWTKITDYGESEPNQCRYLSFINENEGWIASPKKLALTNDSGTTWKDVKLPEGIKDIIGIYLMSDTEGYLVDVDKNLYVTEDSGVTWKTKPTNIKDFDACVWNSNAFEMRFSDKDNGVMYYYGSSDSKLKCSVTKDGGNTWNNVAMPDVEGDPLYLSKDGKFLSILSNYDYKVTLLKME